MSDDGEFVYVDLDGAGAVRRFHIPTQSAGLQFALGPNTFAEDMEVVPGDSAAVAISLRNKGFSPRHEGVAVYDDGVKRPIQTPGHTGSNRIEFGNSASTLYGYNNETTEFGFRTMVVDADGVQTTNTTRGLISGFGVDIAFGDGSIFTTTGRMIDPVARTLLVRLPPPVPSLRTMAARSSWETAKSRSSTSLPSSRSMISPCQAFQAGIA